MIMTRYYVMLTTDQYHEACRRALVDANHKSCQPHYLGRILCVQDTLGL